MSQQTYRVHYEISSCIITSVEAILPRLERTLELLDWNVSSDVLHRLPVLSLQLSLHSGEQKYSYGAKSGLQGGWGTTGALFWVK
ncbi:hypothetical protein J6590_003644 [Homalodisca vitripennis]|nr:hypothetical protein J6590_003644 [Homalodisca vitripennis]